MSCFFSRRHAVISQPKPRTAHSYSYRRLRARRRSPFWSGQTRARVVLHTACYTSKHQELVAARSWRFESSLPHQPSLNIDLTSFSVELRLAGQLHAKAVPPELWEEGVTPDHSEGGPLTHHSDGPLRPFTGSAVPCHRCAPRKRCVRGLCEVGDDAIGSAVVREVLAAAAAARPAPSPTMGPCSRSSQSHATGSAVGPRTLEDDAKRVAGGTRDSRGPLHTLPRQFGAPTHRSCLTVYRNDGFSGVDEQQGTSTHRPRYRCGGLVGPHLLAVPAVTGHHQF